MIARPMLPAELRFRAERMQFITAQHYQAWVEGSPLPRHLTHRKTFDKQEEAALMKGRPYRCALCDCTTMLQIDHIVPQSLGGSSMSVNLRYLCGTHNRAVWQPFAPYMRLVRVYLKEAA
jgi:5-methylcytosine-specific restriction endonuclease McrA